MDSNGRISIPRGVVNTVSNGRNSISRDVIISYQMFLMRNQKREENRLKWIVENLKLYNLNPGYNLMEHIESLSNLQRRMRPRLRRSFTPEENWDILFDTLPKFWKEIAENIVAENAEISHEDLVQMLKEKWIARDIERNIRKSSFLRMNSNVRTMKFSRPDMLTKGVTRGVTARIVADYMRNNNNV